MTDDDKKRGRILPIGGTGVMCGHCHMYHLGACPRVLEIEYYQDGTVKSVKYNPNFIWPTVAK